MQSTGLPENTSWKRDCRYADRSEPAVWKIGLYPLHCWGRNARFAAGFEVGGHVQIWGRIQSREYVKKLEGEEAQKRVAYEVSVSKLEYI